MKILQFGKFYYPISGGMERALFEITEGLNKEGVQCDVLCSHTKPINEEHSFANYKVYRTASYGIVNSTSISPHMITKLWKIAKNYDVIDVHHPDPMAFLALFIVRPKAKIVIHWQSDIIRQKFMAKLFLPLQNWVLKRADKIVLASQSYAEHSADLKNYLDKMEVAAIGIDSTLLKVDREKSQEIKKKYAHKKIIFALGRLVTYKGFDYLIEASRYLGDEYLILIAGKGSEEENLLATIERYDLENKVELLGYVSEEEKYAYFENSKILCLPSITRAEAFGVVLIEAMAFAKPIVLSTIKGSGMNWVNLDSVTGLQVEPRDPEALANTIVKITTDESLYQEFSANAHKRFETLFTRKKMVQSLIDIYRKII